MPVVGMFHCCSSVSRDDYGDRPLTLEGKLAEKGLELLMEISQAARGVSDAIPPNWSSSWMVGLPLIVLTVVFHVMGLGLVNRRALRAASGTNSPRHSTSQFVLVLGATTLLASMLHGIEAAIWAEAYRLLNVLPDFKSAMLYSLNAMTAYGHARLDLELHWELLGSIEALNGWLLFGLTTAFLFGVIQRVGSLERTGTADVKL
jgi:hypothetical protein